MFKVIITKQTKISGFSGVTGEEVIGTSTSEETLSFNNFDAAEKAKYHIENNYNADVIIEKTEEGGGWTEFKPDVYDYYQRKNSERRQRRQTRNYRRYGRKY